ncbi:hypothetical protein LMG18096_03329 [Ralstonia holmesii]|uniref:Transposase n=1 Tax=Ralstonia holmesii TaxID=3058602 RepID=A0ABC8QEK3_9RALS|nr:hypothetical protein LMG18096_03329 [Ralstonia sp. LMG 32967]CAJ0805953.1 hypothetical protein LMG18093_00099 [Ralstonia sp. LMG 32967]
MICLHCYFGALQLLNSQIRKRQPGRSALTHESLVQWLRGKTAEEILDRATDSGRTDSLIAAT